MKLLLQLCVFMRGVCASPRFMEVVMALKVKSLRTFLMVQWLDAHFQHRQLQGSIPGQGTKDPRGVRRKKEKKSLKAIGLKPWMGARGQC